MASKRSAEDLTLYVYSQLIISNMQPKSILEYIVRTIDRLLKCLISRSYGPIRDLRRCCIVESARDVFDTIGLELLHTAHGRYLRFVIIVESHRFINL